VSASEQLPEAIDLLRRQAGDKIRWRGLPIMPSVVSIADNALTTGATKTSGDMTRRYPLPFTLINTVLL